MWKENIFKKIEQFESENPKEYWKIIKELRGPPENDNICNSADFENFYKSLFSKYSHEGNSHYKKINKLVEDLIKSGDDRLEPDFTLKEFNEALAKLRNNKTAGPDRIPAEMIKNSPEDVLTLILKLINKIKNTKQYPNLWALGYTTLIHKDGDEENPDNYRAITICSAMAKLYALMIKQRLDKKVVENKLIGDHQIGFKKGTRPADHLLLLKSITGHYMQNGKKVFACFVDYKKAYDNVWREGLYYKLLMSGINADMVNIIRSMYDNSQQALKINRSVTDPFQSYRGVRQGCVLSPLLFNIFIDDLPHIFDKSSRPVSLNGHKINCLMYADDIVLLSETKEGLQKSLDQLSVYSENWYLKINQKKTKTMIFQKHATNKNINVVFNQIRLEEVKQFKYLGTIITSTGDFKQNDKYLRLKGLRASYQIMKILGRHLKPSKSIKLFEKIVEPILLYNCEITGAYMPIKWTYERFRDNIWNRKLEVNKVVHNFITQLLGIGKKTSNNGILAECGKYPLYMKIFVQIFRYWVRIRTSENKYMQEVYKLERQKWKDRKDSWLKIVDFLMKYTNYKINYIELEDENSQDDISQVDFENKIKDIYKKTWYQNVMKSFGESKLGFICEYKRNWKFETYIDNLTFKYQRIVSQFRLSNHNLPIEVLRYNNIKREKRLCQICDLQVIGDENHYLLECNNTKITQVKDEFIISAINIAPELKQLDNNNIIKYCIHMGDPKLHYVTAKFIEELLNTYNIENKESINDKYLSIFM